MVEALILKVEKHQSKQGGVFYYAFFKDIKTSETYRSCLSPKMRNFQRWAKLIKPGYVIGNLIAKGSLVDADSFPRKVGEQELVKQGEES